MHKTLETLSEKHDSECLTWVHQLQETSMGLWMEERLGPRVFRPPKHASSRHRNKGVLGWLLRLLDRIPDVRKCPPIGEEAGG